VKLLRLCNSFSSGTFILFGEEEERGEEETKTHLLWRNPQPVDHRNPLPDRMQRNLPILRPALEVTMLREDVVAGELDVGRSGGVEVPDGGSAGFDLICETAEEGRERRELE
jgi:hypothetical protein